LIQTQPAGANNNLISTSQRPLCARSSHSGSG